MGCSANVASPSRGLPQCFCERLARREVEDVQLDKKYLQRKEFVIFLKIQISDMQAQPTASLSDRVNLRATNNGLTDNQDADRKKS